MAFHTKIMLPSSFEMNVLEDSSIEISLSKT